jgi:hypothetical protein
MPVLELIGGETWKDFIASEPASVLVLGKNDCENCNRWSAELTEFLAGADSADFEKIRFGKVDLKQRDLREFRLATPWLREVEVLPYNVIYVKGEPVKKFAGGGIDRLVNRLRRILEG